MDREKRHEPIFEIPEGAKEMTCRSCGQPFFFVPTRNGKSMPTNPDGTAHWSSCPEGQRR